MRAATFNSTIVGVNTCDGMCMMSRGRRVHGVGGGGSRKSGGLLRRTLHEYSQRSGIHGMHYLGEPDRPLNERLWWTLAMLTSLLAIASLILHTWQHWVQSPVLVSFADKPTSVMDIPFPTVTVCPSNKYRKHVFNMKKTWKYGRMNLTEEERKLSDDLMLVCHGLGSQGVDLKDYNYLADEESLQNIINVAPTLSDSLECFGVLNDTSCEWMLDTIVTREGVCYSYNGLPNQGLFNQGGISARQVWSLEGGYLDTAGTQDLPVRARGAGFLQGVLLALKTNISEVDYDCRPLQGFKITLTSPADFPRPFTRYYSVPITGMTQMAITPHVMDTEEELRGYPPHQRHCYFASERRLSLFSTYTQDNCDVECLANHTLRTCRCVDFYMPRDTSTPICGYGAVDCMYQAEQELSRELMDSRVTGRRAEISCNCLPSCQAITYSAEISQAKINFKKLIEYFDIDLEEYQNITANMVYVFLSTSEILAVRRRELYGVTSFIASCGGLLGLSCGFSILSLVELLYFFTLRLWNNAGQENVDRAKAKAAPPLNHGWVLDFIK